MKNALIIVDLQNDFLPGGSLSVKRGNEIIQPINEIMPFFDWVIATKDWHPKNHVSFASTWQKQVGEEVFINGVTQQLWPAHCVENTWGSEHPEGLNAEAIHHTFYKGTNRNVDSYSIFFDQAKNRASTITTFLTVHQIKDLYFVGLATEYCVKYSVLDALTLDHPQVFVIKDCCRGLDQKTTEETYALFENKGVTLLHSSQIKENQLALGS
jgi:nicotinamidase/pyrazinamidase